MHKGVMQGKGKYTWADGSSYVGGFQNGLKHGFGRWQKSDNQPCNYYEGEYINGSKHGEGEFHWSNGSYYKGDWKEGKQNGSG